MLPQHGTLEISGSRLHHNLELLKEHMGRAKLCATIKANAYGHGVEQIAPLLHAEGVEWACVYSLQEAYDLALWQFNTLVLAPLELQERSLSRATRETEEAREIARRLDDHATNHIIRVNITSIDSARRLSTLAADAGVRGNIRVHMQIDAGLSRAGVEADSAPALAEIIGSLPHLHLEGVFAHFSHGDAPGHPTVEQQGRRLLEAARIIRKKYGDLLVHIQNSGGAFHLRERDAFDLARVGIALYGLQPSTENPIAGLKPIARVVAPIIATHDRPAGIGVGYGHTFVTQRPTRLAIVPVGYADGYPRALTNNCVGQIRDVDIPVVGRVSMDQIILDITDLPASVGAGEPVVVISDNGGKANSLDAMADTLKTIGYELATHLGGRLKRVVVD